MSNKERRTRKGRLSGTAAGLVLIIGAGGTVGVLSGDGPALSARGEHVEPTAARVVDISMLNSARGTAAAKSADPPDNRGPDDDGGPPSAA